MSAARALQVTLWASRFQGRTATRSILSSSSTNAFSLFPSMNRTITTFTPTRFMTRAFSTETKAEETGKSEEAAKPEDKKEGANADAAKITELQAQLVEKEKQIKDLNDKWLRSMAETENVRQRGQNQVADAKKFAVQGFAKSLLEVADVLELALKAVQQQLQSKTNGSGKVENLSAEDCQKTLSNMIEGIEMTEKVLHKVFETQGLKKFEPVGEKFDPHKHEGLFEVQDPSKEDGTVALVMKSGYMLSERCIRAAQVGTVKA